MSNEESAAAYAATRRTPRQGASPSPVGSTLSIVLALIAVVAGFLILQDLTDDGGSAGVASPGAGVDPGTDDATATTLPDPEVSLPTASTTTTTTTVPLVTTGATVLVANANTVGGSAGAMSRTLELEGFEVAEPVNATGPNLQDSIVHFDPTVAGALDVANSVAFVLGGLEVSEVPTPVPVEGGELDGAGVLLLLGDNEAGRTAAELQAEALEEAGSAVADAPAVSGTEETSTDATQDATTDDAATDDPADDE